MTKTFGQFVLDEATRDHHEMIRHMLALADRPGTPEEGETARKMAHKLAGEHGIKIGSIKPEPVAVKRPAARKPKAASAKSQEPYNGPFPRNKHSHKCPGAGCKARGQYNAVGCYKKNCTHPKSHLCPSCRQDAARESAGHDHQ